MLKVNIDAAAGTSLFNIIAKVSDTGKTSAKWIEGLIINDSFRIGEDSYYV